VKLLVALLAVVSVFSMPSFASASVPATIQLSGPSGLVSSSTATFTFQIEGGEHRSGSDSFQCRLDSTGAWEECTSPVTYSDLADGAHRFEVRVGHRGPHWWSDCSYSAPAIAEFTVDTTPPETTIDSAPTGTIGIAEATVEFAADGPATFECRLDSEAATAWSACTSPVTLVGLADGAHRFEVRAVDAAGNIGAAGPVVAFTVDTTVPETFVDTAPSARLDVNEASFSFSSTEGEVFECRLDPQANSPWVPCASSISVQGLSHGEHVFEVRAGDRFGRFDPTPARVVFFVDIPVNGSLLSATPLAGTVRIKVPGATRFRPLTEGETIAVGSVVDTTEGKVSLASIDPLGEEQRASFFEGTFRVGQKAGVSLVTLQLRGGAPKDCAEAPEGAARASAKSPRAALWGSGHGNFRTEGNNGSATVRGTIWLTEETCDGTFFKVNRGLVAVRDFRLHKTVMVPAGRSYLARDTVP
jgi:hypothetical protein